MSKQVRLVALPAADTLGMHGHLSPHFGRCHSWVLAELTDGELGQVRILANPFAASHDCAQLANLLAEMKVSDVVAGGLGQRAVMALREKGIAVVTGFDGSVSECLASYLRGDRPVNQVCEGHARSES